MKKYGLRFKKTGKLLGMSFSSNAGGDFCGDVEVSLRDGGSCFWLVNTPEHAEYVRLNSTKWYNAGFESPSHRFKPEELEVVRVEAEVQSIQVSIPTPEEFFIQKYGETEPKHLEMLLHQKEEGEKIQYSIYDLQEMLREKQG